MPDADAFSLCREGCGGKRMGVCQLSPLQQVECLESAPGLEYEQLGMFKWRDSIQTHVIQRNWLMSQCCAVCPLKAISITI